MPLVDITIVPICPSETFWHDEVLAGTRRLGPMCPGVYSRGVPAQTWTSGGRRGARGVGQVPHGAAPLYQPDHQAEVSCYPIITPCTRLWTHHPNSKCPFGRDSRHVRPIRAVPDMGGLLPSSIVIIFTSHSTSLRVGFLLQHDISASCTFCPFSVPSNVVEHPGNALGLAYIIA